MATRKGGKYDKQVETKAAPSKPAKAAKEGELRSIRIEIAENGYTVECNHAPAKSDRNGPSFYQESKEYVFESPEKVLAYVKSKL